MPVGLAVVCEGSMFRGIQYGTGTDPGARGCDTDRATVEGCSAGAAIECSHLLPCTALDSEQCLEGVLRLYYSQT